MSILRSITNSAINLLALPAVLLMSMLVAVSAFAGWVLVNFTKAK